VEVVVLPTVNSNSLSGQEHGCEGSSRLTVVFRRDSGKSLPSCGSQLIPSRTEIKSEWLFWARENDRFYLNGKLISF